MGLAVIAGSREKPMRLALAAILGCLLAASAAVASTGTDSPELGNRFWPRAGVARTAVGDLCRAPAELVRNGMLTVDLCQAWNDYDPGDDSCSPCALPGPEIVARLDTQPGERVRITTDLSSGSADVRLYLATDCDDPAGSCIAASSGPGSSFEHTLDLGGEIFLFVDTTGDCATVQIWRPAPASALSTTFTALKAVYR
jgi:hypothetical protein